MNYRIATALVRRIATLTAIVFAALPLAAAGQTQEFNTPPAQSVFSAGGDGFVWQYLLTDTAPNGWNATAFDDSTWSSSPGGFYRYAHPNASWILEPAGDGMVRIKSAWLPDAYLHIENIAANSAANNVEFGPVEASWWSAQWQLDGSLDGGPLRIRNRWRNQLVLEAFGNSGLRVVDETAALADAADWSVSDVQFEALDGQNAVYLTNRDGRYLAGTGSEGRTTTLDGTLGASWRTNLELDSHSQFWPALSFDSGTSTRLSNLLARGTFELQPGQADDLMFWGRWQDSIQIFINGIRAAESAVDSDGYGAPGYRYLGLTPAARALLDDGGSFTIAVQVVDALSDQDAYFDLGLTLAPAVARLPSRGWETSAGLRRISERVRQSLIESGTTGVSMAVVHDGDLILARTFGYADQAFTTALEPDAVMRLASNDKVVTLAAIENLLDRGLEIEGELFDQNTPVFPLLRELGLGQLDAVEIGQQVDAVTVGNLINHLGWLAELPYDGPLDSVPTSSRIDFLNTLGVDDATALTAADNIRWVQSRPTTRIPGTVTASNYNNTGYMVLRYLVGEVAKHAAIADSFEQFIQQVLFAPAGDGNAVVAKALTLEQQPGEPWYASYRMPYERWIYLENYLAVASSAPAFARMTNLHQPRYDQGGYNGRMAGTRSLTRVYEHPLTGLPLSIVFIGNEETAEDGIADAYNIAQPMLERLDLNDLDADENFLHSARAGAENLALHIEDFNHELAAGEIGSDWHSAMWRIVPTGDGGAVTIQNRWQPDHYLVLLDDQPVAAVVDPRDAAAAWRLREIDSTTNTYRLVHDSDTAAARGLYLGDITRADNPDRLADATGRSDNRSRFAVRYASYENGNTGFHWEVR